MRKRDTERDYEKYPEPHWPWGCSLIMWIMVILFMICLLTSCVRREAVTRDVWHYDTVWSEKAVSGQKNDSIVYRERIVVQPHVIRVGDTTIVYSDTTVVRNTERNVYATNNYYSDKGRIVRDTAYVERKVPASQTVTKEHRFKWRAVLCGILAGILISIAFRYGKRIVERIRNFLHS